MASSSSSKYIWWNGEKHPVSDGIRCSGFFRDMPDHHMKRDGIADWVVLYCTGGKGIVQSGEHPITAAKSGDFFCLPPDTPHFYQTNSEDPWSLYWFHYRGALPDVLQDSLQFHRQIGVSSDIIEQFRLILKEMEQPFTSLRHLKCSNIAQLILIRSTEQTDANFLMEQVKQYLQANCLDETPVTKLAAQFGLSQYHFIRQFREYTGYPPNQYRLICRIRRACSLLDREGESISSISERLGYQSPYYFSRQFKSITGYSPREYRKMTSQF